MVTKIFSEPGAPPERWTRPWVCVLINQFAFPGLGSLLARRWIAGSLQTLLMLAGFTLTMAFMARYFSALYHFATNAQGTEASFRAEYQPFSWARNFGLISCALAWCWAGLTSISIQRSSRSVSVQPPLDE